MNHMRMPLYTCTLQGYFVYIQSIQCFRLDESELGTDLQNLQGGYLEGKSLENIFRLVKAFPGTVKLVITDHKALRKAHLTMGSR